MSVEEKLSPLQRTALFMVMLNAFATPLMLSAVNVALPHIAKDLNLDAVTLSWIPMVYLMASAMFVLIFGRLADMYGRKRIFLTGTACVIVTSLLAAFSNSGGLLISARFLQGMSAAMLYATQIAIVSSVFPPKKRGHAIGQTVSLIYLGLAGGPLIGGIVVDLFGWRGSFLLHIPLALIVLLIGILKVPGDWHSEETGSFDVKGAVLYSISILLLCAGISFISDTIGMLSIGLSLLGIILFFHYARGASFPIFDVRLFIKNRIFTFSCLASFISYTAVFANVVLISLYLQYLKGIPASTAGIIMMTQPLTMAIIAPIAGRLSDRKEPRIIATLGMIVTGAGLLMLAALSQASTIQYIVGALFVTGLGFSLFSSPNANAIMGAVEKQYYGSATGSIATMRILGQMSSMVIVTLIFALMLGQVEITISNYGQLGAAISMIFKITAILCVPGILLSLARGRMH